MEKKDVVRYIELLNKYQEFTSRNEIYNFTQEELSLIEKGNEFRKNNQELQRLFNSSLEERQKYIDEYYQEQNKPSTEKDIIEEENPNTLNANVEQLNNLTNRYEDIPEEKDEFEQLDMNIQLKAETYSEMPEQLMGMPEEERQIWEHYIELYKEHRNKKYAKKEIPKQKILTPNGHGNGTIDIVMLLAVTLVTLAAAFLVSYQILK